MNKQRRVLLHVVLALTLIYLGVGTFAAWGQTTTTGGNLNVSVTDPAGAAVPGAELELRDLATNVIRHGTTLPSGVYSFLNVPGGTFTLTITAKGFSSQLFESVEIRTSVETEIKASLKIGATSESVTVSATEAPLLQTESSTLSTNFDTRQVFDLPQLTRSAFSLVYDVPGYTSGTFNNLPGGAIVSAEFDGTQSMSNRFRDGGFNYGSSVVDPRLENIAEFTVTTSQLDLSGNGTSAMRISIVTKRGTNGFHGLLYEDFRNTVLNANSWNNNATTNAQGVGVARSITKYNNFGVNVGGPIRKNKLFFFGTFSEQKNPNTSIASSGILNPLAQQGIYQYLGPTGAPVQVNLFQIAAANGLTSTLNPVIKSQLAQINTVSSNGLITPNATDPNLSTYTFTNPSTATNYYPTVRVDYNASDKMRFNISYTQQKSDNGVSVAPSFPGIDTADHVTYSKGNNKIVGLGMDYAISPTLFNNLRLGYLYQFSIFDPENTGIDLPSIAQVNWAYSGATSPFGSNSPGQYPRLAISSLYSMYSINDTLNWQRGAHSFTFGFAGFREWDRYWNNPGGFPIYNLGINSNDPAYAAINNATASLPGMNTTFQGAARNLYATLIGDISGANIDTGRPLDWATKQYKPYGQYNLNEIQQSQGFWFQDRWRLLTGLTLNYGIRWDIVNDDYDKDGAYTSAKTPADIWGPTPVGALFQPGASGGVGDPSFTASQHKYHTIWKTPQPAVALAWNPHVESGLLGKLLGNNKTVIRTGYSLRNYQDGAQNVWAFGSEGLFFYQQGSATPDPTSTAPGFYKPGSLILGSPTPVPSWALTPTQWSPTILGDAVFGQSEYSINPNIRLPYVESWNLGVQRQLGASVLDVSYVGNLVLHTWTAINYNEVNIYENGFLQEWNNAEANLAINQANGKGNTPYNFGLAGQKPLPIFTAAFANAASTSSAWTGLYTNLVNGAVGSQARTMLTTTSYLCNLIGSANFSPCAGTIGAGVAGVKPLNFWGPNPYARAGGLNYLDAAGMSDYEALQAQYRTRLTHGAEFTMSYTLAHSLANGSQSNIQSQGYTPYTLRNLGLNYLDSSTDIRHAIRIVGTYDLPFGKGKALVNQGGVINSIVGNWTLGTISSITSGGPNTFSGGYGTVNNNASGVVLANGMTAKQFQNSIQIQHTGVCTSSGCNGWVQEFSPYLAANGTANPNYFTYNTTPGVWGQWPIIRGPWGWASDMSATKRVTIHENYRFMLQVAAQNVFNHPTIGLGNLSLTSTSFGRVTPSGSRQMVLRANIEF